MWSLYTFPNRTEGIVPCCNCDSEEFGTAHVDGLGIVLLCGSCGFIEEASPSEVALFIEEQGSVPFTEEAA